MASALLNSLTDALAMVEAAGSKNGGLIVNIVHVLILGISYDDLRAIPPRYLINVELNDGILKISGERTTRQQGKRHYHAMEVQIGPFERRFRLPVVVDPVSIRATYEHGFLEIRLAKQPPRSEGVQSVRVGGA